MFWNMGTAIFLVLVLFGMPMSAVSFAQNSDRGSTLVCAGSGGDGWTLEEWTAAELSDYEIRLGRLPALAHPGTGTCQDPAGLMVETGWVPGTKWLCSRSADQSWGGPNWVWEMYQRDDSVSPDPVTGRCPLPWSYPQVSAIRGEAAYAAATAVHLTELEVAGNYDRLYAWMHPDSQAVVPQVAMEGWYRDVFAQRPPVWMTVDDVQLAEWTWGVTGKVYPSAAEITFRQRFEDGVEEQGEVHLVRDNGVWRWFFGSDRDFLNEQISRSATTTGRPAYSILDLGTGKGNWSSAYHINERGQALWTWATTPDPMADRFADSHAMLWWNSAATSLFELGLDYAIAINDAGVVLAGQWGPQGSSRVLYDIDSGSMTPVTEFNGGFPTMINDAGVMVGWIAGSAAIVADGTVRAIPVPEGFSLVEPVAINEADHVAGTAAVDTISAANERAILYIDGAVTILPAAPGDDASSANDLNDLGQVVGSPGVGGMHHVHQYGRAFLYDHATGISTDLGTLPGYQNSVASAINNAGQVVGSAWLPENWQPESGTERFRRAFLYDHRVGEMSDLNQLVPRDSGWYLVDAFDINDAGQIVGRGLVDGEMHAFLLTPSFSATATAIPTPRVIPATTSVSTTTATAIPALTALHTPTLSPRVTPTPALTTTSAPTQSSLTTVGQVATDCQLVELYPGYPGYRGYVAGIDGPGEVACLEELVASDPTFDKDAEDAANIAAARAIGLAGSPENWTWENWMAIEAERGLPVTCYSCLFREPESQRSGQSAAWDPADPRLRMGAYGTSEAIVVAAAGAGMDPGGQASGFFQNKFDPNDEDSLGPDHVLRAFVGLTWPGHHTAPEMIGAYDELFALYAEPGSVYFDLGQMWTTILNQGGYAPTPRTAHIEDQMYMVRTSAEAMCAEMSPDTCRGWLGQYERIEELFLSEYRRTATDITYAEWLREEFPDKF